MRRLTWSGIMLALAATAAGNIAHADDFTVPPGWQRAPQPPFTAPAGTLCPFTLREEPVKDEVITRVLSSWPDGSPREQVFVGAFYGRFTNVDTGAAVVRNMSGDALVRWGDNFSSATWDYFGPVGVGFPPGGPLAPGMYIVDGVFIIDYAADGTITMPVHEGTKENLCETLAK